MVTATEFEAAFADSFMQPEIYFGSYFEVETVLGTEIVPGDVTSRTASTIAEYFADYVEGRILDPDADAEYKHGWLARMSAPGYLDCTPWGAFETEQEAMDYLVEMYAD